MINLGEIDEQQLLELFRRKYTIVDLNEEDEFSPVDWLVTSSNTYIEVKCRNVHYDALILEEDKYNKLLSYEKSWYICSTPEGIYGWDIKKLDPIFRMKLVTNSQQFFRKDKMVFKSITELPIQRCHYNFAMGFFLNDINLNGILIPLNS